MVVVENFQSHTALAPEPEHDVQQRDRCPRAFDVAIDDLTVEASSDASSIEALSVVELEPCRDFVPGLQLQEARGRDE